MARFEAISGNTVGSDGLWMGQTHVAPSTRSSDHHHGESETGIYVVRGNPVFVFLDGEEETRLETGPGDYVYVPPWVPHREENPDPDHEAVVVRAAGPRRPDRLTRPGNGRRGYRVWPFPVLTQRRRCLTLVVDEPRRPYAD
jgi:uncharacterized RmlC-like cupin family protein